MSPSARLSLRVAAVATASALVLAAVAGGSNGPASSGGGFGRSRVLLRHAHVVSIDAAGGAVWVVSQTSFTGQTQLRALDARSGAVRAHLALGQTADDDVLLADGWLWVTTAGLRARASSWLWRLAPSTLQVMSRTRLSGRPGSRSLAVAGASLWVGDGDRLDDVAVIGGSIVGRIPVHGASQLQLATGPAGRTLLVSAGNGSGVGYVQRRDGSTGALLATSLRYLGVTEPELGGTAAGRLWLTEATGTAGSILEVWVGSLRPIRVAIPSPPAATPFVAPSNGVSAQVIDGVLWVSQSRGGPQLNYCADPVSGRPRGTLPVDVRLGQLLTADAARIYYLSPGSGTTLSTAAIPARCR